MYFLTIGKWDQSLDFSMYFLLIGLTAIKTNQVWAIKQFPEFWNYNYIIINYKQSNLLTFFYKSYNES